MKKIRSIIPFLFAAFVLTSNVSTAQTESKKDGETEKICSKDGKCLAGIPDMTDQQKQKAEDLCLAHQKTMTAQKNILNEKQAHLKTLQGVDKPDMTAINKTIDEISGIKSDMMKKCAATKQSFRELLTEKQRVVFDSKSHDCCGFHGGSYGHAKCKSHSGADGCSKSCNHGGHKNCGK